MTRFARFAVVCVATLFIGGGIAEAQTETQPEAQTTAKSRWPADGPFSAQFDAAATLGHKSSSSFGAELTYRLNDDWDVFLETGHMRNVATSDLDARAQLIANFIGGTTSAVQKANYFDIGARYRIMGRGKWDPYVTLGLGVAHVETKTNFAINGTDVTNSIGDLVSLGPDLSGSLNKAFLTIGPGVNVPLGVRYFFDGCYRYGRIFPRSAQVENDKGINTQRVQVAIGIKF
jgi:opacity protein-like surface antigen